MVLERNIFAADAAFVHTFNSSIVVVLEFDAVILLSKIRIEMFRGVEMTFNVKRPSHCSRG